MRRFSRVALAMSLAALLINAAVAAPPPPEQPPALPDDPDAVINLLNTPHGGIRNITESYAKLVLEARRHIKTSPQRYLPAIRARIVLPDDLALLDDEPTFSRRVAE